MFGLGKKKTETKEVKAPAKKDAAVVVAVPQIPEDQFTIMPQQYLPKKGTKKGISQKVVFVGAGVFVLVVILGVALYFITSGSETNTQPQVTQQTPVTTTEQETQTHVIEETIAEKAITAEAYDLSNKLLGSLAMTVPTSVVAEVGESIGIAVLSLSDIGLSASSSTQVVGGIYSLYPAARTFVEPISFELLFTTVPADVDKAALFPARLVGTQWREIEDYQISLGGYLFEFEKFPTGPIALVYETAQEVDLVDTVTTQPIVTTTDTDGDGLTDKEEQLIGTSTAAVDSDEDTYSDLEEIENGYSPLVAGERLESAGIFTSYTNPTYGYTVTYPTSWLADALDQTNKQVLYISETEEFFEILIEENPLNTPIVDWYRGQAPSLANAELDVTILDGRPAVWSPDGLTLFSSKNGLVYILTYNKGALDAVNWPYFFSYFYRSFSFGEVTSQSTKTTTGTSTSETIPTEGEGAST